MDGLLLFVVEVSAAALLRLREGFYPSRGLQALVELFCEVTRTLKQSG